MTTHASKNPNTHIRTVHKRTFTHTHSYTNAHADIHKHAHIRTRTHLLLEDDVSQKAVRFRS